MPSIWNSMRVVAASDEVACTVTTPLRPDANAAGWLNATGPGGAAGGMPPSSPPPHAAIKPSRAASCDAARQRESKRLFIVDLVYPGDEQTVATPGANGPLQWLWRREAHDGRAGQHQQRPVVGNQHTHRRTRHAAERIRRVAVGQVDAADHRVAIVGEVVAAPIRGGERP